MYDNAVANNNTSMQIWLSKAQLGYREPEKKPVDPNEQNKDSVKEIKWSPSIRGFEDCGPDKLKEFMVEFLDLPPQVAQKMEKTGKDTIDGKPVDDKGKS